MTARLVILLALTAPAFAQESATERTERARAHFERGKAHFNLGEYEDAVREFEAGYREKPQPLFLYDIAEAARKAGMRDKAIRMYRQYLHEKPDAAEQAQIQRHLIELEQQPSPPAPLSPPPDEPRPLETRPSEPSPAPPPRALPPPAPVAIPAPPPVERPWSRDPLAISLAAIGAAALLIGVIDFAIEYPRWQARNDSYAAHDAARATPAHLTCDVVLMPVGAVLLTAAGVRWAIAKRSRAHVQVSAAGARLAW